MLFNEDITEFVDSYDGRNKEPVVLPVKIPSLLMLGAEGIAVVMATKIMPHNFIDLVKGSIDILKGKRVKLYPDFPTGGFVDVAEYNQGGRGGRIKVRAKIEVVDKKTL